VQKDRGQGMKILVVEDDKCRIEWFQMVMKGHDVWIAKSASQAITYINSHLMPFDEIWLDHDLGIHRGSGMDVVEYLTEITLKKNYPSNLTIHIHSANTPAAINMKKKLDLAFENVFIDSFLYLISRRDEMMVEYKELLNHG